jgi:hypothetical protein
MYMGSVTSGYLAFFCIDAIFWKNLYYAITMRIFVLIPYNYRVVRYYSRSLKYFIYYLINRCIIEYHT